MHQIGIDLEQFVRDPYGSGIQRVLQNLARWWPEELAGCTFVVPVEDSFLLLDSIQAAGLVDLAFENEPDSLGPIIRGRLAEFAKESPLVRLSGLLPLFHSWLLPEVSYLPSVVDRFKVFGESMPTAMIGFDALPMTDPENYRFRPDRYSRVSEYFRQLATADVVVCISDYARETIVQRLRRDPVARTTVAYPGGDHLPLHQRVHAEKSGPMTFLRVGTMEARKRPVELVQAFRAARESGANAELIFVGRPSASDASINATLSQAVKDDIGIQWLESLADSELHQVVTGADYFVSVGVEGFGIPVLEAIRLGTPVLYGGIQPAGEIMRGRGATPMGGDDGESLTRMFREFSSESALRVSLGQVQGEAVPHWADFARGVVQAVLDHQR